jgi:flagellar biosynthesis regulator FlbT
MAYSDFTLPGLLGQFQLTVVEDQELFVGVEPATVPQSLADMLSESAPLALAINTEKARSEMIIVPILLELRKLAGRRISLFSGSDFTVAPEQGLTGFCDFIVSRAREQLFITAPALIIFEARNDNIKAGLAQCLAAMLAAQIFNARAGKEIEAIYGLVTTGSNWKFLRLTQQMVSIDRREYYLNDLDEVLGVLLHIVGEGEPAQVEQLIAA